MLEKEIKFIIDFTLNRIKKLGSYFTYDKLVSAELHPAIILYISAELDFLIYEDRKKLLQNSAFDYSGSEISKYFNLIGEEIKKNKRLTFEDVKTLVTRAVTFNVNYLIRPNLTLSQLIFTDEKTRNVNEIKMMLNYLYYYDYVKNVFHGYFSKRKILSLSGTEFDMILGKIDQQMFSEHTNDLIDNALVSISEFLNEGGVNKTQIAAQTVEIFLKEKNMMEALFKLRRSIPSDDKRSYDIEDIRRILYSTEPVEVKPEEEKKKQVPEKKVQVQAKADEPKHEEKVSPDENSEKEIVFKESETDDKFEEMLKMPKATTDEEISIEDIEDNTPEPEPEDDFLTKYETELKSLEDLESQLRRLGVEENLSPDEPFEGPEIKETEKKEKKVEDIKPEVEDVKPGENEIEDEFDEEDFETSDELIFEEEEVNPFDQTKKMKKEEKTETKPKRAKDILSFLKDKEMERIVSNVFNEDEEDFATTMEKISESAGYDDATEILKAVFFSYKISPLSRDAVTLTNAVSNYFDQDG